MCMRGPRGWSGVNGDVACLLACFLALGLIFAYLIDAPPPPHCSLDRPLLRRATLFRPAPLAPAPPFDACKPLLHLLRALQGCAGKPRRGTIYSSVCCDIKRGTTGDLFRPGLFAIYSYRIFIYMYIYIYLVVYIYIYKCWATEREGGAAGVGRLLCSWKFSTRHASLLPSRSCALGTRSWSGGGKQKKSRRCVRAALVVTYGSASLCVGLTQEAAAQNVSAARSRWNARRIEMGRLQREYHFACPHGEGRFPFATVVGSRSRTKADDSTQKPPSTFIDTPAKSLVYHLMCALH